MIERVTIGSNLTLYINDVLVDNFRLDIDQLKSSQFNKIIQHFLVEHKKQP